MALKNKSTIVRSFTEVWDEGTFYSATSSDTILPGTLVQQHSGGQFIVPADVNYPPQIVVEDELQGKTFRDEFAVGAHIRVKYLGVGERYVVLGKAAETIAIGALLSPHTDGTVTAHSGPTDVAATLFRAETAVSDSDTGSDRRLVVTVLRV